MKSINRLASILIFALSCLAVSAQYYTQMTDLPTVYIDTEDYRPITSKETYIRATLRYVDADGEKYYDALGIRGRGNSTWKLAKKPYRIKFDKKQEFLGSERAKAKSWTLLANYSDKSLMRNALAASLGDFAGQPFTAAARFVDLVLNGEYIGNYQISDQIEVRAKRVDIVEQDEPMTDSSNITGGYLLEVDGFADSEPCFFKTRRGVKITVKSPDDEIIDWRQVDYIQNYIQKFEDALFSNDFTNPDTGYRSYVDESTLMSWYVASEMSANYDTFWSTYIYKNQDDPKIYWGPLWDYDIAFNNCQRRGDMTRCLVRDYGSGADLTGVWIRRMWEDPWFVNAVNEKWKSMVVNGLEDHLLKFIDEKEAELSGSQSLDGVYWPINIRVYDEYRLFSTYSATVDFLRKFVRERISYLTETFAEAVAEVVPPPPFELEESYYYRIHNANTLKCADITGDGSALCGNTYVAGTETQQWDIQAVGNGYYVIVNRATGRAITDASPMAYGSYQCNSQLSLEEYETDNLRQQWEIVPMTTGGIYVIANRLTGFAWNNSGGNSQDGNPFISWYNDADNPNKPNRHWQIIRDEIKEDPNPDPDPDPEPDPDPDPEPDPDPDPDINEIPVVEDYMVTYSPSGSVIRFVSGGNAPLSGTYTIVNINGMTVRYGCIVGDVDVSSLPAGMYAMSWEINGQHAFSKFVRY